MSTPTEEPSTGEVTPAGDPLLTPVTVQTTDDSGNTTVIGYPSGYNQGYTGTPGESPGGGVGNDEEPVGL